jgi:hypothetical protein
VAPTHPLLHAHSSEITIERIRRLVREVGPESPVVEYKAQFAKTIAKGVAALANTYGGLILVGVSDDGTVDGVESKVIESVAEHCVSKIEPPYLPEIIPVRLAAESSRYVLVIRVVPGTHVVPLLVDGVAWVRHQNTSHPADWSRLRDLFAVTDSSQHQEGAWNITAPQASGDQAVDLVLRSGITIAVSQEAMWRPLQESTVDAYRDALTASPLASELSNLTIGQAGEASINQFRHKGFNRSRTVRLEWSGYPSGWRPGWQPAVEAIATLDVPGAYGRSGTHLRVEIDVVLRFSIASQMPERRANDWRINPPELRILVEAMLATLVDEAVLSTVAELAGVHPIAVPQPRVLHLVTRRPVAMVLNTERLRAIPDAGTSHGAHLLADPARDLSAADERRAQVSEWLVQIASDAGLRGMQQLLDAEDLPVT